MQRQGGEHWSRGAVSLEEWKQQPRQRVECAPRRSGAGVKSPAGMEGRVGKGKQQGKELEEVRNGF